MIPWGVEIAGDIGNYIRNIERTHEAWRPAISPNTYGEHIYSCRRIDKEISSHSKKHLPDRFYTVPLINTYIFFLIWAISLSGNET
jgi:hypothetical protein